MSVVEKITAAREKYGDEVYNKTLGQLRNEFGQEAFPEWIAMYEPDEDGQPLMVCPFDHAKMPLWHITETYCYPEQSLPWSIVLNEGRNTYFQTFVQVLK